LESIRIPRLTFWVEILSPSSKGWFAPNGGKSNFSLISESYFLFHFYVSETDTNV
jgi:hypothetical protein